MSTKLTLKQCVDENSKVAAQLYEDCFKTEDADPIYLRLTGLKDASLEVNEFGTTLNVEIPRQIAVQLGLLK
jgi:Fe-S-cluster formation regulator IscX/YfhJ